MRHHTPVMLREVLDMLRANVGGFFFDGTFGQGGHTRGILLANPRNIVYAVDRDPCTQVFAERVQAEFPGRLKFEVASFKDAHKIFDLTICDGFLLDLGLNQDQLFSKGRGFSFYDDLSFDCRINQQENVLTGAQLINQSSPKELKKILKHGGLGRELPFVLRAILKHRPFNSAKELGDAIVKEIPKAIAAKSKEKFRHVTLQAIRIAVNEEWLHLREFLESLPKIAKFHSRVVIICFHSLEDQHTTSIFRKWGAVEKIGKLITKKPVRASEQEVASNPASRSALMRVFEFGK